MVFAKKHAQSFESSMTENFGGRINENIDSDFVALVFGICGKWP